MPEYVTCTNCRAFFPLPQNGQQPRCPQCSTLVPASVGSASGSSLSPSALPNKTILAEPEAMIRYTCPRCSKALESPASFAGRKLNCPGCNQRLQIPQSPPLAATNPNKTILAISESAPGGGVAAPSFPAGAPRPPEVPAPDVEVIGVSSQPATPPAQRESCLECGKDLGRQKRVQTCPDCGSLFCSAHCYREHRYHAHRPRQDRRYEEPIEQENIGLSVTAMVLGIISAVIFCFWPISMPLAILAIILGSIGASKGGQGMAIAGVICGIAAIVLFLVFFIIAMTGNPAWRGFPWRL